MNWEQYLSNPQYAADNIGRKDFGEKLMLAMKQKNISDGIMWYQAIHLHSRLREWEVTLPEALGSLKLKVDLINMLYAGDIETATLALTYGQADDMSLPTHWFSQERIDWVLEQSRRWLGWIV